MGAKIRLLQPGDPAPEFVLPSVNREGTVSAADLRGRPFLIGLYRGLHCPFCRRQLVLLAGVQPILHAGGVETLAVINTREERARLYFRHRPSPVTLMSDPDCHTHRAFGVPRIELIPEGSSERPEWPYRMTMEELQAVRINPNGVLPEPMNPMDGNTVLNAKDGFELEEADKVILANHPAQGAGHFLVDAAGIVRWAHLEARDGPEGLCTFPTAAQIITAAGSVAC